MYGQHFLKMNAKKVLLEKVDTIMIDGNISFTGTNEYLKNAKLSHCSEGYNNTLRFNYEKQPRKVSFELLRVISMLMIITHHFLEHGDILKNVSLFSPNYYVTWMIESLAYVAVNCYVLISGYFLINSKFKIKKLLIIYGQIWFYSVSIFLLLSSIGVTDFNFKSLLYSLLPISTNQYWFSTIYIAIYLFSPFLNIAIKAMTKKQLQLCIFVSLLMFSLIPNVVFFVDAFGTKYGYSIYWFVCLYLMAAYIRLYYTPSYHKKKWLFSYLSCCLLMVLSRVTLSFATQYILGSAEGDLFYSYNSLLVAPASICLFLFFVNWNLIGARVSRIILFISPLTFGVYLIHDNKYVREFLWNSLLKPFIFVDKPMLILYLAVCVLLIYVICSLVEKLRQVIFKTIENGKWIDGSVDRGVQFLSHTYKFIDKKIFVTKD